MVGTSLRSEGAVLRLTLYDVRHNESREIRLRFIEWKGQPHILYPTQSQPDWVSQVGGSAVVRWSVRDKQFIGTARQLEDPVEVRTEILPAFEAVYGKERLSRWFG